MRSILFTLFLVCGTFVFGQKDPDLNMKIIAHIPAPEGGSGIWHYVDKKGIEYAAFGSRTALVIYSLEDPAKPIERYRATGVSSTWREVYAYGDYIYGVTDQVADGLIIINMKQAPNIITHKFWKENVTANGITQALNTCHTVFVDEKGVLCLNGCDPWDGVLFFDIKTDPENPKFLGDESKRYCHDMYMRHDTLWSSDILNGLLSIWDVKDKSKPVEMATITTPYAFTHNAWISNDSKYVFTTDEKAEAYVASYDVSDLSKIKLLDVFRPKDTEGKGVIPHNTRYLDGYLITAYYTDGVKIIDANKPDNLVEVGTVDTYFGADGGFHGCWGVSPYLPSKTIIASDIEGGLFVIKPEYIRACYLEGDVRDSLDGKAIQDAKVVLLVPKVNNETTDIKGEYKTGYATAGTYKAIFSHINYYSDTVDVVLNNGIVTIKNVKLIPKASQTIKVTVLDSVTKLPLANAKIVFQTRNVKNLYNASADGSISNKIFPDTISTIYAGIWGYHEKAISIDSRAPLSNMTFELTRGYKDDFVVDMGWKESSTATVGKWIKVEPIGTAQRNVIYQTDVDLADDLGDECYVTGNGDTAPSTNDLDNGSTTLLSPLMDVSKYNDPVMVYYRWFTNGGGTGTPNDKVIFSLHDGTNTKILETITTSKAEWIKSEMFHIKQHATALDKIQLSITASDDDPGHLVEAAIDGFLVYDANPITTGIDPQQSKTVMHIANNPFHNNTLVQFDITNDSNYQLDIIDMNGKVIQTENISSITKNKNIGQELTAGKYQLILRNKNQFIQSMNIIKQ